MTPLAYEDRPTTFRVDAIGGDGGGVRVFIPVTAAVRRAVRLLFAGRLLVWMGMPVCFLLMHVILHGIVPWLSGGRLPPKNWHQLWFDSVVGTIPALGVTGAVLYLVGMVRAARLRPTVVQVDGRDVAVSRLGLPTVRTWDRRLVRRVTVRRYGRFRAAELWLAVEYDDVRVASGLTADVEAAAVAVRAALGLPPAVSVDAAASSA